MNNSTQSDRNALCPICGTQGAALLFRREFRGQVYSLAHCRKCGQHFCHPIPTEAQISEFYEGDYHGELRTPGGSEKVFGAKFAEYRDWILQFVKVGRCLDIGASTGLMPGLLKQAGFDAEGIEHNVASAQWGEQHYGVRIRTGDIRQHADQLGTFDLISMTDVLEHIPNPIEFLGFVCKHLRAGGFMLVTFPDIGSVESNYSRLLARLLGRDWVWYNCHIPLHVSEFRPATARAMFDKAGLDVVGFRRRDEEIDRVGVWHPLVRFLLLPMNFLKVRPVGHALGTQMQFMLRKRT